MSPEEISKFKQINAVSEKGGIVFLGSDFLAGLPVGELAKAFHIDENIHNRSAKGATVRELLDRLDVFALDLYPDKIFLQLGETEADEGMSPDEFRASFEWLLCSLHNQSGAEIYVVSIAVKGELSNRYNEALKGLCSETGCKFIDVSSALAGDRPEIRVFDAIKFYLPRDPDLTDFLLMR